MMLGLRGYTLRKVSFGKLHDLVSDIKVCGADKGIMHTYLQGGKLYAWDMFR